VREVTPCSQLHFVLPLTGNKSHYIVLRKAVGLRWIRLGDVRLSEIRVS
jgi:hypothetical protein